MANEATLVERWSHPSDFIIADATAIAKGAVLMVSDPATAAIATNGPVAVAGIAAREKVASDGRTRLAVYQDGRFLVSLSGSCTTGDPLIVSALATTYPNYVEKQGVVASGSMKYTIGISEEDGTNGNRIVMILKPAATIAQN